MKAYVIRCFDDGLASLDFASERFWWILEAFLIFKCVFSPVCWPLLSGDLRCCCWLLREGSLRRTV